MLSHLLARLSGLGGCSRFLISESLSTLYVETRQGAWVRRQGWLLGSRLPAMYSCPLPNRTTLADRPFSLDAQALTSPSHPLGVGSQLKTPNVGI